MFNLSFLVCQHVAQVLLKSISIIIVRQIVIMITLMIIMTKAKNN